MLVYFLCERFCWIIFTRLYLFKQRLRVCEGNKWNFNRFMILSKLKHYVPSIRHITLQYLWILHNILMWFKFTFLSKRVEGIHTIVIIVFTYDNLDKLFIAREWHFSPSVIITRIVWYSHSELYFEIYACPIFSIVRNYCSVERKCWEGLFCCLFQTFSSLLLLWGNLCLSNGTGLKRVWSLLFFLDVFQ